MSSAGFQRIGVTAYAMVLFCVVSSNTFAQDTKATFRFANFTQVAALFELIKRYESGNTLNEAEQAWLQTITTQYKVTLPEPLSSEVLNTLRSRVDIVPPSLGMAQSAEESGWGTSCFADFGNARDPQAT
jgi:Bax protein